MSVNGGLWLWLVVVVCGGLWSFVVGCGRLWLFAVGCGCGELYRWSLLYICLVFLVFN